MPRKPAWVYRHIDAQGQTIYVGCTDNLHARFLGHRGASSWWPSVVKIASVGPFPRDVALRLERLLIHVYDPPNNIAGTSHAGRVA